MSLAVRILGRNGSLQERASSNTSLLLSTPSHSVLVDCSGNLQEAVHDPGLAAVVITHEHIDHVYGFPSLIHQLWLSGRTEPLKVYAPETALGIVQKLIDAFSLLSKKGMFHIELCPADAFSAGDIHITPFRTDHTGDSLGLIAEADGKRIVYTSDTRPIASVMKEMSSPDILITDIKMPFVDGFELSQMVKRELPSVKILILTGYSDFDMTKAAIKTGASEYLLKPVSSSKLLKTLHNIAGQIQTERENRSWYAGKTDPVAEFESAYREMQLFSELISEGRSFSYLLELGKKSFEAFGELCSGDSNLLCPEYERHCSCR